MATQAWIRATKNSIQKMLDSPLTIRSVSDELTRVYMAMNEQIPSRSALDTPVPTRMFDFLTDMMKAAIDFLDKNGDKLPQDGFTMQLGRMTLSADKQKVAIYYTRGFAFPVDYLEPEDSKGVIQLVG